MLENLHKCDIYKLVINLVNRFITDILPSDAARPRGQYISYKPPSRFITLTYTLVICMNLWLELDNWTL